MTSALWFLFFILLIALGVPIAAALALAVFLAIMITGAYPLLIIPNMMHTGIDSYTLLAVPFFIFAGKLMSTGSTSNRIFDFANSSVGWMRGGLGSANVVGSLIFGGLSGSGVADVGALGPLEVKTMTKHNYPLNYSCALTAASAILSPIIPPSVIMIIFSTVAGVSAIKMLIAGLIPGLLAGVCMIIVNYILAIRYGWKSLAKFNLRDFFDKTRSGFWALLTPFVLLGGIVSGYFTPTEAAFVASAYSLFIGIIVYRDLPVRQIARILLETGKDCGVIMLILATAMTGSHVLTSDGVTQMTADFIFSITKDPVLILMLMGGFLIVFGMVMETIASIIITVPVFLPIALEVGISPIHFGVVMIVSDCIGYITPPVGVCLFTICTVIKDATFEGVAKSCIPFVIGLIFLLVLIILFPSFSVFLPSLIN